MTACRKAENVRLLKNGKLLIPPQISIVIVRKKRGMTISGQPAASAPTFTISFSYLTAWIHISTFVVREAVSLARGLMGVV